LPVGVPFSSRIVIICVIGYFVASDFDLASLGIMQITEISTKFTEHLWLGFDH